MHLAASRQERAAWLRGWLLQRLSIPLEGWWCQPQPACQWWWWCWCMALLRALAPLGQELVRGISTGFAIAASTPSCSPCPACSPALSCGSLRCGSGVAERETELQPTCGGSWSLLLFVAVLSFICGWAAHRCSLLAGQFPAEGGQLALAGKGKSKGVWGANGSSTSGGR